MNPPPLALYIHLPWCVRKCPYCDFNSHTAGDAPPTAAYVDALRADIANDAARAGDREIVSVFIGGGTPSLFSPAEIGSVLDAVGRCCRLAAGVEVTMEANPGSVESGDPAGYRSAGVNRLSIGAQSFDDAALRTLGRVHRVDDISRAVAAARAGGFDNLNLDLMYGLPGQDVAAALADLDAALALGPEHLSWYHLTLEPNTVFFHSPPAGLPDDDAVADIELAGRARLAAEGFERYEVSAFARPGRRCRHNLNYWEFGDYLGVGAGAHGKLTDGDEIRRYSKPANPRTYLAGAAAWTGTSASPKSWTGTASWTGTLLSDDDRLFEFLLNALRLTGGFTEALFSGRTGLDPAMLRTRLEAAVKRGLIARTAAGQWQPTALGERFLNDLQAETLAA